MERDEAMKKVFDILSGKVVCDEKELGEALTIANTREPKEDKMGFIKAYRLIEFSNIGSLNEWFDENRDIEVVKLEIREIHSIIRYYLLYKKII